MEIKEGELNELLKFHLQKEEKAEVYEPRVEANMINGIPVFKATWSWWAFLGGWAFFLYRKMYLTAVVVFILSFLLGIAGILVNIAAGVSGFYLYTRKFNDDLKIAGYGDRPLNEVRTQLKHLGGYHQWVVWLYIAFIILFAVISIFVLSSLR